MSLDDNSQDTEHEEDQNDQWPVGLDSLEVLQSQSYLVARGARPMCLVGEVPVEHKDAAGRMLRMVGAGGQAGGLATLVPFMVLREGPGDAEDWYCCGYAKDSWVVDTYAWLASSEVPVKHRQRLTGLLLGYGVEPIGHFSRKGLIVLD